MTKTVLITGAGSGFGKGVALALAHAGHGVIAGCHIWPQVTDLRAEAAARGLEMRVIKLDVLSEIDRNHALALDFDVLFNNAGIMESGPVAELPMQIVRASFETNVFVALAMAQGAARKFIKAGGGRIVWTSSVAGLVGVSWDGAYSASKFAGEGFCLAMREELRPYGVEVCTVNPGAYRTGFNDTGMEAQDQWWAQGERVMEHWPVRELKNQYDPAEMVQAMVAVLTTENPPFRTVLPAHVAERVREEQAAAWDWTV